MERSQIVVKRISCFKLEIFDEGITEVNIPTDIVDIWSNLEKFSISNRLLYLIFEINNIRYKNMYFRTCGQHEGNIFQQSMSSFDNECLHSSSTIEVKEESLKQYCVFKGKTDLEQYICNIP